MSHVRYSLLCWGLANKGKTNEINRLKLTYDQSNKMHQFYKLERRCQQNKITKKILDTNNMFRYNLEIFMH